MEQGGTSGLEGIDSLYRKEILDHYKHPHNAGRLSPADITHRELNPLCGDEITVFVRAAGGKVAGIRFTGRGCAISQASMSMLTDFVLGKPLSEILRMGREQILQLLMIPVSPTRLKCALLGLEALKNGIRKFQSGGTAEPDHQDPVLQELRGPQGSPEPQQQPRQRSIPGRERE